MVIFIVLSPARWFGAEALPASRVEPRGDPLSSTTVGQTPKRFFAVSGGIVTPPESSIRKAWSVENQPGRRLKLRQRHGQLRHTYLHCQSVNAPMWPASAATPAGYTINLGYPPGRLRGATGKAPSAHAERTRGRGEGGSGSTATATGYAIGPRWSASAVIVMGQGWRRQSQRSAPVPGRSKQQSGRRDRFTYISIAFQHCCARGRAHSAKALCRYH